MKVESEVIKELWDGFVLNTILGKVVCWKNRHGWYTEDINFKNKLSKRRYLYKKDIISEIDLLCNKYFDTVKHLIVKE